MAMAAPEFDPAQIHDYAAVLPVSALNDLVTSFRSSVSALLMELTTSFGDRDRDRLAGQAHDLKGVSGSFGARRLQNLAEQLEQCCRQGTLTGVGPMLTAMQESAMRAFADLEAELSTISGS